MAIVLPNINAPASLNVSPGVASGSTAADPQMASVNYSQQPGAPTPFTWTAQNLPTMSPGAQQVAQAAAQPAAQPNPNAQWALNNQMIQAMQPQAINTFQRGGGGGGGVPFDQINSMIQANNSAYGIPSQGMGPTQAADIYQRQQANAAYLATHPGASE